MATRGRKSGAHQADLFPTFRKPSCQPAAIDCRHGRKTLGSQGTSLLTRGAFAGDDVALVVDGFDRFVGAFRVDVAAAFGEAVG